MSKGYRYRDKSGSTWDSLAAVKRNLHKVGKIRYIRGYVYFGKYGTFHNAVIVRGEKGTARFAGFSWGYNGTGPNGLYDMLRIAGVEEDMAKFVAYKSPWDGWSHSHECWRIAIDDNGVQGTIHGNETRQVELLHHKTEQPAA